MLTQRLTRYDSAFVYLQMGQVSQLLWFKKICVICIDLRKVSIEPIELKS